MQWYLLSSTLTNQFTIENVLLLRLLIIVLCVDQVNYLDHEIGTVISTMKQRNLWDSSLVVLHADSKFVQCEVVAAVLATVVHFIELSDPLLM